MNANQAKYPQLRFKGFTDPWEQRKLGAITDSFSGGTPTAGKAEYYGGEIPFIRSGEISSDSTELFITDAGLNNSSAKMVGIGDILYALYGATSGETSISRINGAINQAILAIRPTKGDDPYMIVQWLKKQKETIISTYLQGGQGNLSGSIVKDLLITLPKNKDEQAKVGSFFKQLDQTITLHQRKLAKLKELKQGYLQKLFPQNGSKFPQLRFARFADAWEQRKLGEVATFLNGRAYKQDELLDSGKYKVLRVGNFYTNDSWYYSNMELGDKYYVDKGDLVYTWSATFGPHIWSGEKVIYHYHIWKVELSKFLDRNFTLQLLEADKARLLSSTNGSTMIHVTKGDMESKIVSIPNIDEQKQIGSFFKQLDNTITLHQRKLEKLQELKKGYLQKMFC
ncbi:restriction endonuclease subunit S [Lentilactobacillus buchneri]|uniref:restriction endonuclease subunit S n=1 Tax=Lentilactobacillus buchneri TaxID=1581 RepID=UPI0021A7F976|nr:restriction endonuclease subunit S [Lentilactobacillus buchneri]MCT3556337.1 restriction endonuclease subunit S [Lentilactobacillus buchneri]MCT3563458.1 restriction endonuclease subunit S [Lentilactobacillus buchneri]